MTILKSIKKHQQKKTSSFDKKQKIISSKINYNKTILDLRLLREVYKCLQEDSKYLRDPFKILKIFQNEGAPIFMDS